MIIGITGRTGVGKHTAGQFFEQRDWKILNVDKIAHRLYHPYQRAWREIVKAFGEDLLNKDDTINRQKLKIIVFSAGKQSEVDLKKLNSILHPEIKRYLKDEVYYLRHKNKNVVIVSALWKEIDLSKLCDVLISITSPSELAYERVKKRDGIDLETYNRINKNQTEAKNADFYIANEGDFQAFYKKLNSVISKL